jgi:hypothetical protein
MRSAFGVRTPSLHALPHLMHMQDDVPKPMQPQAQVLHAAALAGDTPAAAQLRASRVRLWRRQW